MESRSTLIFFTSYTLVIFMLYWLNQQAWTAKNFELKKELDSLKIVLQNRETEVFQILEKENTQRQVLAAQKFDGYDSQGFRVYGLYRDEEKKYSTETIALKFNIFPPSSVKTAEVLGERWFIVPVKGLHFVEAGQSSGQIARLYYQNLKDSLLLTHFNPQIKEGRYIFIPFDKP